MDQTRLEGKNIYSVLAGLVFLVAIALRGGGNGAVPPFDDVYHLKRISFSVSNFPRVLEYDRDRRAFCPWPPLYDVGCAALVRGFGVDVHRIPPFVFALFSGVTALVMATRFGLLAGAVTGLGIACSPYLIGVSSTGRLDHHWVEPFLVLAILAARRRPLLLGLAISAALFVQPALLVAAGLAFVAMFFLDDDEPRPHGFVIAMVLVLAWRWTRPAGYPDNAWFLGYAHAAALGGAAAACAARRVTSRGLALASGCAAALAFPSSAAMFARGALFFGGDPWLETIVEFQPMFRDASRIGTDVANLTGGALLAFVVVRRHRALGLFAIVYLLLAISSRRFLVPGIPLFVIAGAVVAAQASTKRRALIAATLTLLPPLSWMAWSSLDREPRATHASVRAIASEVHALPPGRVLAPWSLGHAIDVLGEHPVVIDNFGSMPHETAFENANDALLQRHADALLRYCRANDVRYVVFPDARMIASTAAANGLDAEQFRRGTKLARRTLWSRLRAGETIAGFERVAPNTWRLR